METSASEHWIKKGEILHEKIGWSGHDHKKTEIWKEKDEDSDNAPLQDAKNQAKKLFWKIFVQCQVRND